MNRPGGGGGGRERDVTSVGQRIATPLQKAATFEPRGSAAAKPPRTNPFQKSSWKNLVGRVRGQARDRAVLLNSPVFP